MYPVYGESFVVHLNCAEPAVGLVLIKWLPSVNVVFPPVQDFTELQP